MTDTLLIIIAVVVVAAAMIAFGAVLFWGADRIEELLRQSRDGRERR